MSVSYDHLTERADALGLPTDMAENHGILCGLLCGGAPGAERLWLAELLEDQDPDAPEVARLRQDLAGLGTATRAAIEGPGLGFAPLLPDDERPLSERARALRDWCRGFLYGLGLSGIQDLSAEAGEALRDLSGIAAMGAQADAPAEGDESEQDEEAYAELCEFVRVAAMLIHAERNRAEGNRPCP